MTFVVILRRAIDTDLPYLHWNAEGTGVVICKVRNRNLLQLLRYAFLVKKIFVSVVFLYLGSCGTVDDGVVDTFSI